MLLDECGVEPRTRMIRLLQAFPKGLTLTPWAVPDLAAR